MVDTMGTNLLRNIITGEPYDAKVSRTVRRGAVGKVLYQLLIKQLVGSLLYYTSIAHSQIRLYDDKLEFWNAGSLPVTLTPELLLVEHDSMPRNSKIADAFFYMGLIEQWGSGTTRIASELQAYGYPLPQFKSELGSFALYSTVPHL